MHRAFRLAILAVLLVCISARPAHATVFGEVQGIVHDPQHRPIANAHITIHAADSQFEPNSVHRSEWLFSFPTLPLGNYTITVQSPGFNVLQQTITVFADNSPILHFPLQVGNIQQSVQITANANVVNGNSVTPTTLIDRSEIAQTPAANLTNSPAMITDYVPGAYMVHDMLHMRGGHQVSWEIDGVEIPNTNIADNLGPQIDPKDISNLEVQRGSYNADVGDRTYGVFDVSPRTGFDRDNEAELTSERRKLLPDRRPAELWQPYRKVCVLRQSQWQPHQLRPDASNPDAVSRCGQWLWRICISSSTTGPRTTSYGLCRNCARIIFRSLTIPTPTAMKISNTTPAGLRDSQNEVDGFSVFSWVHTFNPTTFLQLSPYYHYNSGNYDPDPNDLPVATTADRASNYGGVAGFSDDTIRKKYDRWRILFLRPT